MTPDIGLLDGAVIHIEQHPEEHEQNFWFTPKPCGMAFCLAGHVGVLAGAEPPPVGIMKGGLWFIAPDGSSWDQSREPMPTGALFIKDYAIKALGVTEGQAEVLFHHSRTVGELRVLTDLLMQDSNADLEAFAEDQGWTTSWS